MLNIRNKFHKIFENVCKREYEDIVTPYNITVLTLIKSYYMFRAKLHFEEGYNEGVTSKILLSNDRNVTVLFIRDCLLNPEIPFDEMIVKLVDLDHALHMEVYVNFLKLTESIAVNGLNFMIDFICDSTNLLSGKYVPRSTPHRIGRITVVGLFIRRMVVMAKNLQFAERVRIHNLYRQYYRKGIIRVDKTLLIVWPGIEICKTFAFDGDLHDTSINNRNTFELVTWSRKQTDLFLANQATLIHFNENAAFPPSELNRRLQKIIQFNPNYSQVYYLSYLNCLRVKEYSVGLQYLTKYLDLISKTLSRTDKMRPYRYAALTFGVFHAVFGNWGISTKMLGDAMRLSQNSDDIKCLLAAFIWQRYTNKEKEESRNVHSAIKKLEQLRMSSAHAVSLQMYAADCVTKGYKTDLIFRMLTQSDLISYRFMLYDFIISGFACRSFVWSINGRPTLMFTTSQNTLNLNLPLIYDSIIEYNTQGMAMAFSNCALYLMNEGEYGIALDILKSALKQISKSCEKWILYCIAIISFEQAMASELLVDAEAVMLQICAFDYEEGLLRKAQLYNKTERKHEASEIIRNLLRMENLCPVKTIRAYLIISSGSTRSRLVTLQNALHMATRLKFGYYVAIVQLEIARLAYEEGLAMEAISLLKQCKTILFSENTILYQAQHYLLYSQCLIALCKGVNDEAEKNENIVTALDMIDRAKNFYQRLRRLSDVKYVLYLQAIYAHIGGMEELKNSFAFKFRQLHEENPSSTISSSSFD